MIDLNQTLKEEGSLTAKLKEFKLPQIYYAPSIGDFKESLEGKYGFTLKTTKKFWPFGVFFYGHALIIFPNLEIVREFDPLNPQRNELINGGFNFEGMTNKPNKVGEFKDITDTLYASTDALHIRQAIFRGGELKVGQRLCTPHFELDPDTYTNYGLMELLSYTDILSYSHATSKEKELGFAKDLAFGLR